MKGVLRYLRVYRTCLKNALIREMEFRLNFFIWGLAMLVEYVIIITFFNYIYGSVQEIGGYTKDQFYFYLGFVQLSLTVFMIFVFPNTVSIPWRINSGEMDFLLLKPISSQFMLSLKNVNFGYIVNVVAGIVLAVYGITGADMHFSAMQIIGCLFYFILGTVLLYSVMFTITILAIWTGRSDFASELFFNMWSILRNPASIYGNVVRVIISYILPVLLIVSTPVDVLFGKANLLQAGITLLISVGWFALSVLVWKRCIRNYTSASS